MKTTTGYFACAVLALCGAAFTPGCSSAIAEEGTSEGKTEKTETTEAELTGVKTANDLHVLGSLDGASATATFKYTSPPLYRAYKFGAHAGDKLDIWVRSTNGNAMAWVLNDSLATVAQNNDAAKGDTNAHVTFTAKAQGKNAAIITHYLVVRELHEANATFTVTLSNAQAFFACKVDADCVATGAPTGCCDNGTKFAVNASEVAAWKADDACTPSICPMFIRLDNRVAECNNTTHACEMVAPSDVVCEAYSVNSHTCPSGFTCEKTDARTDVGGKCVETCGGITGKQCSNLGDVCVDDPSDGCDPAHGGADCGGICQPKPACVNNKMCMRTAHFDAKACACVPNPVCGGTAQTHCDAQYAAGCVDDPNGNCHLGGGDASCTGVCSN